LAAFKASKKLTNFLPTTIRKWLYIGRISCPKRRSPIGRTVSKHIARINHRRQKTKPQTLIKPKNGSRATPPDRRLSPDSRRKSGEGSTAAGSAEERVWVT
jgi:hypothetical protein